MPRKLIPLILLFFSIFTSAKIPVVAIEYSQPLDSFCSFIKGPKIEDEWKNELLDSLESYRRIWSSVGTELLSVSEDITGNRFSKSKITAYLTLCAVPSQSIIGISVNMRYALSSFTDEPVALKYKVAVLYHEVLHEFVDDHLPKDSVLLSTHSKESSRVLNHLHLLALLKSAYIRLGLESELEEVISIDSKLPGGFYKKAWQIINENENTYKLYVSELGSKNS